MEMFTTVVIMAVLVQAIIEGIKGALSKWDWISLGLGAVVCALGGVDLFKLMGVPLQVPYVGAILTGLIVGRGAAAVYDIWRVLKDGGKEIPDVQVDYGEDVDPDEDTDEEA